MLRIRRYQSKDRASVKALYNIGLNPFDANARAESYLSSCPDLDDIDNVYLKGGEFIVGIYQGKLVAMGGLQNLSRTRAEIRRMGVHPDCHQQGFGQLILQKLESRARQLGYMVLCLDTTAQNEPAQKLYEKFGFVRIGQKKIGQLDVIFYEKQLPDK